MREKVPYYAARILFLWEILSTIGKNANKDGIHMDRKNTGQLLQELMDSNDLDRVLSENDTSFREDSLTDALQRLFDARDISKATLAKNSGISEVYLHQVFSGRRSPSRNRLLCLCFGLRAEVEDAQRLLQHAHHAPLYPLDRRDAILIYGLSHGLTLPEVNDALFNANAETLC